MAQQQHPLQPLVDEYRQSAQCHNLETAADYSYVADMIEGFIKEDRGDDDQAIDRLVLSLIPHSDSPVRTAILENAAKVVSRELTRMAYGLM